MGLSYSSAKFSAGNAASLIYRSAFMIRRNPINHIKCFSMPFDGLTQPFVLDTQAVGAFPAMMGAATHDGGIPFIPLLFPKTS
jgi:hypothetical protein